MQIIVQWTLSGPFGVDFVLPPSLVHFIRPVLRTGAPTVLAQYTI
jgi:hypothetical protein